MKNSTLIVPVTLILVLSGCASNNPVSDTSNFAPPSKIIAPRTIAGNSGKYMCPFTAAGMVADWAKERYVETDNGSDLAANVGGAVGQQAANKALEFVPFGLGGMIGQHVGESAGRAATRKEIDTELPSMDAVRAGSDISFNSVDKLALYMYVKHSTHIEYARVLELTKRIYPELQQDYVSSIEKASQPTGKAGHDQSDRQGQASKPETKYAKVQRKLVELQSLKNKGVITESEYTIKRNRLLGML